MRGAARSARPSSAEEGLEPARERDRLALAVRGGLEPARVGRVAHVRGLDQHLRHDGEVEAAEIGAHVETVAADVGRVRLAGDRGERLPDGDRKSTRGGRVWLVDDLEPAA